MVQGWAAGLSVGGVQEAGDLHAQVGAKAVLSTL